MTTSVQKFTVPKFRNPFKSNSTSNYSNPSTKTAQLPSNVQKSSQPYKRKRAASPHSISKKSKTFTKPSWRLLLSFYDEDLKVSLNFRCFSEETLIPPTISETLLVANSEDDDCRTEENEIRLCSDYVAFQLELAILKAEINA